MAQWHNGQSKSGLMAASLGKCKVMHVGHNDKCTCIMQEGNKSCLGGPIVEERDLQGLSQNLKVSTQCSESAKKAVKVYTTYN